MRGIIVGIWAVVGVEPRRNASTGQLVHDCACPCGHVIAIAHSILVYNTPAKCPVCEKEATERRRMEYAASKVAGKAALREWQLENSKKRYQAQQEGDRRTDGTEN